MPDKFITIRDAINTAIGEEMAIDKRVILIGEDVGVAGNIFKVTQGLLEKFGRDRVFDTPIAEAGIMGVAVGAAMTGMRPIIEIMFSDFLTLASDQIVNQAAKLRYMTGGQASIPLVIRTAIGSGRRAAAQHSQSLQAWFCHIPGLKVLLPSNPYDAKGLLKSAVRDDNPIMFMEPKMAYSQKGQVPEREYFVPIGKGRVVRKGKDISVIATSITVSRCQIVANDLIKENIDIEIIDPRSLKPLDMDLICESVKKTRRAIVIDEGYLSYGVTAEIAARINEEVFNSLMKPVKRLGGFDVPVPFAPTLEDLTIPNEQRISNAIRDLMS